MKGNAVLLLALMTFVSCTKKWGGSYSGSLTQYITISTEPPRGPIEQASANTSGIIDVIVTDGPGDAITIEYPGCKFNATKSQAGGQAMATARAIDCPFPGSPGVTFHVDYGSLTLTQSSIGWTWVGVSQSGTNTGSFGSNFVGSRKL